MSSGVQDHRAEYIRGSDAENKLINDRLTWLLAGQGLLFLAYGTLVTAKLGEKEAFAAEPARKAAMEWVPIIGLLSALVVWVGILGALIAIFVLSRRHSQQNTGVHIVTTLMGFTPAFFLPLLVAMGWWFIRQA
jgi:hypothetical protein